VSFNPDIPSIMQYATNFFSSTYPIAGIFIGTAIGAFVIGMIIGLVRNARNGG
jgi:hypothetical protein